MSAHDLVAILASFGGVLAVLKGLGMAYGARANAAARSDNAKSAMIEDLVQRVRRLEGQLDLQRGIIDKLNADSELWRLERARLTWQRDAAEGRAKSAVIELENYRAKGQR